MLYVGYCVGSPHIQEIGTREEVEEWLLDRRSSNYWCRFRAEWRMTTEDDHAVQREYYDQQEVEHFQLGGDAAYSARDRYGYGR